MVVVGVKFFCIPMRNPKVRNPKVEALLGSWTARQLDG